MKQKILLIILVCYSGFISCQNNKQLKGDNISKMNDTSEYRNKAKSLVLGLKQKGIKDERVLDAIGKVPRHAFVDKSLASRAYEDRPLPIDKDQTISQPYTVAFQTELLQLKPGDKVLEIGTGSGYQAAVLCEMRVEVYSIERHYQLHIDAKELLKGLGYVPMLFYGDGYKGLSEYAPFDKILITAAAKEFPKKLLEQLKIGGLMVAPIGNSNSQIMTVIQRLSADKYQESEYGTFAFVPMLEGVEE